MSVDKSIFTVMGELANKIGQLFAGPELSQEDKNNAEICAIVKKMMINKGLDDSDFDSIIVKLEPIYSGVHRHSYSNISSTIYAEKSKADIECRKKKLDSYILDVLADNNDRLHKHIINYYKAKEEPAETDEIVLLKFQKLYDHIKLEVVRLKNYDEQIQKAERQISESSEEAQKQIDNFSEMLEAKSNQIDEKFQEKLDKVQEESSKLRAEYISILGIFSAIVIVFFGGTAVFTSMLTNIHQAKWYEIGMGASAVGLVLFDVIFMFLYVLSKFHGVSIAVKEESEAKCNVLKYLDKYPYVIWFNFLCIVAFILCA